MSSSVTVPARPRGKWLSFSIRALLVFQFLLALPLVCLTLRLRDCQRQAQLALDWRKSEIASALLTPSKPDWFWKPLGEWTGYRAHDITSVNYGIEHETPLSLEAAEVLASLPCLRSVGIYFGTSDETAIAKLLESASLEVVALSGPRGKFVDRHFHAIGTCRIVKHLTISVDGISAEALGSLAQKFPNLESLTLEAMPYDFASLRPWIAANKLKMLRLSVGLNDSQIEELARFESLEELRVPAASKEGTDRLRAMPNMKSLSVGVIK